MERSVESPKSSSTKSAAAAPNAGSTKRSWMPSGWKLPGWQAMLPSWKKKSPTIGHADSGEAVSKLTDAGTVAQETQRNAPHPTETRSGAKPVANAKNGDWKFYLDEDSPIVDAPSIGPKMARRLEALHVNTVADFLALSPEEASAKLGNKALTAETIRKWQAQTRLACRTPGLRGHDAQILVACGVTEPEELASMNTQELMDVLTPFMESPEAERILRGASRPDHAEVAGWIDAAQHARPLKAA
jgi:predicted flap endonuclease-1-like 5' DNA nuclease